MIDIDGTYFDLKIERKNNRNIYLRVSGNTLLITCPKWVKNEEIYRFIEEKSEWIKKTITKSNIKRANSKLQIGDFIFYKGKKYRLIVLNGKNNISISDETIIIYCKDGNIDNAIKLFYKESKKTILNRVFALESKYLAILNDYGYHLEPDYKVKLLKSAWGVNYPKKNLIVINERLIHFDDKCLEAILWHELLHFVIPNHSKRFHEVLEYHMKDYKDIVNSIY